MLETRTLLSAESFLDADARYAGPEMDLRALSPSTPYDDAVDQAAEYGSDGGVLPKESYQAFPHLAVTGRGLSAPPVNVAMVSLGNGLSVYTYRTEPTPVLLVVVTTSITWRVTTVRTAPIPAVGHYALASASVPDTGSYGASSVSQDSALTRLASSVDTPRSSTAVESTSSASSLAGQVKAGGPSLGAGHFNPQSAAGITGESAVQSATQRGAPPLQAPARIAQPDARSLSPNWDDLASSFDSAGTIQTQPTYAGSGRTAEEGWNYPSGLNQSDSLDEPGGFIELDASRATPRLPEVSSGSATSAFFSSDNAPIAPWTGDNDRPDAEGDLAPRIPRHFGQMSPAEATGSSTKFAPAGDGLLSIDGEGGLIELLAADPGRMERQDGVSAGNGRDLANPQEVLEAGVGLYQVFELATSADDDAAAEDQPESKPQREEPISSQPAADPAPQEQAASAPERARGNHSPWRVLLSSAIGIAAGLWLRSQSTSRSAADDERRVI